MRSKLIGTTGSEIEGIFLGGPKIFCIIYCAAKLNNSHGTSIIHYKTHCTKYLTTELFIYFLLGVIESFFWFKGRVH